MVRCLQLDEQPYATLAVSCIASEAFGDVVVVAVPVDTGG